MATLTAAFHLFVVACGMLSAFSVVFSAGRVSERMECSDHYRQQMWRPLSRFGAKTMIVLAVILSLLITAVSMAPLLRSPWARDDIGIVAVFCVLSGLPVLVISVLVFLELYARYLERISRDCSGHTA